MGFGQGLSGLNAASQNLDVIGNNIANSGTVGFKSGSATFADVYANSRVGLGVQVASINQRFTTGIVSTTGNQFDMAIDGAKGLFVVTQPNGATLYTRNGQFFADKDNRIVNAQGQQLMGYAPGGTNLIGMTVPYGNISPQATSTINNIVNLDADAKVVPAHTAEQLGSVTLTGPDPATTVTAYQFRVDANGVYQWEGAAPGNGDYQNGRTPPDAFTFSSGVPNVPLVLAPGDQTYAPETGVEFDPLKADSFSNMTPLTAYDSLGNEHRVEQYYVKRAVSGTAPAEVNNWDVYVVVDGKIIAADGNPQTAAPYVPATQMRFDSAGRLDSTTASYTLNYVVPTTGGSAAEPMSIIVGYGTSTQFKGDFTQNFIQNGYASGEYASMSIGTNGELIANYTNGAKQTMGVLALADFNNLQGLQPVGGNAWAETANSGQPILGAPGSNGLATIKGQSVEESNVDMSQELVNMIIAQRTYQANAQTIKTQDQILQTLITMR